MRIGRIILALLAPLLSLSPAVKAQSPSENKQPDLKQAALGLSDFLADFLRLTATPASVTSQATVRAHRPHATALAIFAPLHHTHLALVLLPVPTAASLQAIARQSQRLRLRC